MAATDRFFSFSFFLFLSLSFSTAFAAILPEERADALYHSYEGGGVTIDGPSILIRKNVGDKFSFSGNYYVDMVTSASIDVLARASEYTEERTEYSLGLDYLNDRTIMSLSYSNSTENDYDANTVGYTISQEFFGDLSTLTLGFAFGDDTVSKTGDDEFEESTERKRYSLGLSQILTTRFVASFSYESVIDEGFLNNPYREIRRLPVGGETEDFVYLSELYPGTRNSEAFAIRGIYATTNSSSIRAEYRLYKDSWGVESDNIELRYSYQMGSRWLFEVRARQYNQAEGADFYQDLFDFSSQVPDYYARDKELSEYTSQQFGLSVSYTFKSRHEFFNNSTLNFSWDRMTFDYDNFRDATQDDYAAGEEPLYSFEADVFRLFYSAYF